MIKLKISKRSGKYLTDGDLIKCLAQIIFGRFAFGLLFQLL